jgi:hypothetical protein
MSDEAIAWVVEGTMAYQRKPLTRRSTKNNIDVLTANIGKVSNFIPGQLCNRA